jgi:hypothetical protein
MRKRVTKTVRDRIKGRGLETKRWAEIKGQREVRSYGE